MNAAEADSLQMMEVDDTSFNGEIKGELLLHR